MRGDTKLCVREEKRQDTENKEDECVCVAVDLEGANLDQHPAFYTGGRSGSFKTKCSCGCGRVKIKAEEYTPRECVSQGMSAKGGRDGPVSKEVWVHEHLALERGSVLR